MIIVATNFTGKLKVGQTRGTQRYSETDKIRKKNIWCQSVKSSSSVVFLGTSSPLNTEK